MENQEKVTVATSNAIDNAPSYVVARHKFAEATASEYGALGNYAKELNARWLEGSATKHWFEVGGKEVNDFAKIVNEERDAFYEECKALGVKAGTYRKRWSDVKAKAKEYRLGVEEQPEPTVRELDQYNPEELLKIYKRNARAEKRDAKSAKVMKTVADLLQDVYKMNLDNI